MRLFRAAAHNPEIAKRKGISQEKAARMAAEGVKKSDHMHGKRLAKKMMEKM